MPFVSFGLILIVSLSFQIIGDKTAWGVPWLCLLSIMLGARYVLKYTPFPGNAAWFFASFSSMFLLFPASSVFFQYDIPTSNTVLLNYNVLTVGGISLFFIAYEFSKRYSKSIRRWNKCYVVSRRGLLNMLLLFAAINIISISLFLMNAGGIHQLIFRTRLEHRVAGGAFALIALYIMVSGGLFYTLSGIIIYLYRPFLLVLLPAILAFDMLYFFALRTRTPLVLHAIAFGFGWFIISRRIKLAGMPWRGLKGFTVRQRILALFCFFILVIGAVGLRSFRGNFENRILTIDFKNTFEKEFFKRGTFNSTDLVFGVLKMVPDKYAYLQGQSYYRVLFIPIPRAIWPDKPVNTQRITARWLDPDSSVIQTTPVGIQGDLYINFGLWGVLGMLVYGFIFAWLDKGNKLWHILLASVSFPFVYHLARGGFTNPLLLLALLIYTSRYLQHKIKYTPETGSS